MLSLLLALTVQTAPLPADPREAAMACATSIRAMAPTPTLEMAVPATYLAMLATSLDKDKSGPFADRLISNSGQIGRAAQGTQLKPGVIDECKRRFPKAWAKTATLPGEKYERGVMCTFVSGAYYGIVNQTAKSTGDAAIVAEEARLSARIEFYAGVIPDADYNAHGIHNREDIQAEFGRVLTAALDRGNVSALFAACEAAYPR